MTKWEYRREVPSVDYNDLGAEGWELCGFTPTGMAVFKRPLREERDWPDLTQDKPELERLMKVVNAARLR